MLTNEYLKRVYDGLAQRNANEPEFLQAVREVLESIQPVVEKHPEYEKAGLIERVMDIIEMEQPHGVIVSTGGQIPNNLAMQRWEHRWRGISSWLPCGGSDAT